MNTLRYIVGIWDPSARHEVSMVKTIRPPNIEETESCVKYLKGEITNYLQSQNQYKRSLKLELPSVNSGGLKGSVFSASEIWDKIYFSLQRKIDKSGDTASIRWIRIKAPEFGSRLERSIRELLTKDVLELRCRAYARDDFMKSMKALSN